ncbi:hypothetical protein BJF78_19390 [Pseudonocardia sp. CNS-139]|nr:hypothetical protein BJF78_19390 [Pseudonocardia sp. CNS-139]
MVTAGDAAPDLSQVTRAASGVDPAADLFTERPDEVLLTRVRSALGPGSAPRPRPRSPISRSAASIATPCSRGITPVSVSITRCALSKAWIAGSVSTRFSVRLLASSGSSGSVSRMPGVRKPR